MSRPLKQLLMVLAASVTAFPVMGAGPIRTIGVYVQPYYQASTQPGGRPRVAVGKQFDALLASNRREDIVAVRDAILAKPDLVTPMTLMVLAIRLYDVGLRDDSVFWFYAAKNRFATLAEVLDLRAPALAQVEQATRDFATVAGPFINGYAFCDLNNQRTQSRKALDWVEKNTYQAVFIPNLPARPGDRRANLQGAIRKLRAAVAQEGKYLEDPANVARLRDERRKNGTDEQFCWKL